MLAFALLACSPIEPVHTLWEVVDTATSTVVGMAALSDGAVVVSSWEGRAQLTSIHLVQPLDREVTWSLYPEGGGHVFTTSRDTIWQTHDGYVQGIAPDGSALGTVATTCPIITALPDASGDRVALDCGLEGTLVMDGAGTTLWEQPGASPRALSGDAVLTLEQESTVLAARSLEDGSLLWEQPSGEFAWTDLMSTGRLVGARRGLDDFALLDGETGEVLWTLDRVGYPAVASPQGGFGLVRTGDGSWLEYYSEQGDLLWSTEKACQWISFDADGRALGACLQDYDGSDWWGLALVEEGELVDHHRLAPYDPYDSVPVRYEAPLLLPGGTVLMSQTHTGEVNVFDVRGVEPGLGTWSRGYFGNRYGTFSAE